MRVRLALTGALVLVAGCGLFGLRNPETPVQHNQVPFNTPTEPRIALSNLKATLEARVIDNYTRSITDDFAFRFDQNDRPSLADSILSRTDNINKLTRLMSNQATVRMTWTVRDSGNIGSDKFYRNLGYRMVYRRSATDSSVVGGHCTLYFRQTGVQWLIYRWADVKDPDPTEVTWGYALNNPNLPHGSG